MPVGAPSGASRRAASAIRGERIPTTMADGRRTCAAGGYAFKMCKGRIMRIDEELDGGASPGQCADVSPRLVPAAQRTKP